MEDFDAPDGPMNEEQESVASSLSSDFIKRIDDELLSHCKKHERKVAMIVGLTMMNPELRVSGLPDIFYAQRVRHLVDTGALLAEGNLAYMRYSEVRLP